ncbi:uncharacterized protein N0V89_000641 [Didymosphaeria variabile]|uniref:Importin N-terminal domain-containing protein n=1 Tax=Didymosphaeria variabile TaxID=1932322 RepID=A0A9W8XUN2_9PLEO|nr:uncharacterized protein N0V89_000641 [Didymosphaeria variabile]KAJ4360082.1 hypothetical protein N0V89_000641 [Didymosphaeria variabile]
MAWQPEEGPLRQLAECLRDSLSGQDPSVQKNAENLLKQAKASPDIDKYLAYVFSNGQPPPVVDMDAPSYFKARAAAAVMLKNDIKASYKTMPEDSKSYIKSIILNGLQDPNSQMRGYAGNVITEIVRSGGLLGWSQVLSELVAMIGNANANVPQQAQEGGMSALLKICEDNKKALNHEHAGGQRALTFLFPKLLEFTTSPLAKVRADALSAANVFIPDNPPAVQENIDTLLQQLFNLSADPSNEVRKHVCRSFKITPYMEGLVEYMVTQQRNSDDADLALDAAEFWLCAAEDEKMREHLGPYLAKIVPVLLESMVYGEDDILRLEGEKEDAELEDRDEDIKPAFATSKSARLTTGANGSEATNVNGTTNQAAPGMDDDDLSEGEIDDFDDDDSVGDPEEQWNLRNPSSRPLPYLTTNLSHAEWPQREAAVLALGAIADGCMEVVQPHLPMLTPYMITLLSDPEPVVRQITCWSLGRYSGWASHLDQNGKQQFFVPMMDGILQRMLDGNKRVQEAAASAFANLEEKANSELAPYCPIIVRQFVQCFANYKYRNMFILYDCVQTLAEHVGPALAQDDLVSILMPALIQRWNKVSDQSREMFPLLECLSYVATALGGAFERYAAGIFSRCVNIIHRNLQEALLAATNPTLEAPDKDFLVTSLDVVSAIIQALDPSSSSELVARSENFFQLLCLCMKDDNNDVRQSAYALLGDCAIYVFDQLRSQLPELLEVLIGQLELSQVMIDGEETGFSVINNACWSVGEIAMREKEGMQRYIDRLLQKIATILFTPNVPDSLNENAAIALGRLGLGCSQFLAPHLAQIAPPFIRSIENVMWTDEKGHALTGFMQIVLANPGAMEQSLLQFFNEMSKAERSLFNGPTPGHTALWDTFQKVIETYKAMIPDFDAFLAGLPAQHRQKFRDLYGV